MTTIHAFGDDALGDHDAVGLARLVRDMKVSPDELAAAAIARAQLVDPELRAVACDLPPRHGTDPNAEFFGVPTFIKDNTDVAGLPRELIQAGWDAFRFWRS